MNHAAAMASSTTMLAGTIRPRNRTSLDIADYPMSEPIKANLSTLVDAWKNNPFRNCGVQLKVGLEYH